MQRWKLQPRDVRQCVLEVTQHPFAETEVAAARSSRRVYWASDRTLRFYGSLRAMALSTTYVIAALKSPPRCIDCIA